MTGTIPTKKLNGRLVGAFTHQPRQPKMRGDRQVL
jgi:hypothetical protein